MENTVLSPDNALEKLLAGNHRYVHQGQLHPRQTQMYREAAVMSQNPFAAILSCSDSRVPSELVFDQGLSDLFIVRTAGHVIDDLVIGSIEFAVHALGVPLIIVMGHTQCGAIKATIQGDELPGRIGSITDRLQTVVHNVRDHPGDTLINATHANTLYTVKLPTRHQTKVRTKTVR